MVDPNDGSVVSPVGEVSEDEEDDSNVSKDVEDIPSIEPTITEPANDPFSTEISLPLPIFIKDVPPSPTINNKVPKGVKMCKE